MILILEDDPEQAFLLCHLLGRETGECCHSTAVMATAETQVLAGMVSLLISDLRLGNGSGVGLLRRLHARHRHPPLVVYTGLGPADAEFLEATRYTDAVFEKGNTPMKMLGQIVHDLLTSGTRAS